VRAGAGLVPQLRRSVISVPSNVAEGHDRPAGEQLNYLRHARGSLWESATQLELLRRRGAVKNESVVVLLQQSDEIGRLIHGYMRRVAEDDD
jgi:four helix bundle protein